MKKKISILDVAREAGVSKSTVSRVLNGEAVSEQARAAVQRAIETVDYRPHAMTSKLHNIKNHVIGIVTVGPDIFGGNNMSQRLAGIGEVLIQAGYSIMLVTAPPNSTISALQNGFRFLEENRIDGLISTSDLDEAADSEKAQKFRKVVYTGERISPRKGFRVYLGNYNYSRDLYQYLFSNGHRKILTLIGEHASSTMRVRREDAYRDVCQLYGENFCENTFFNYSAYASTQKEQLEGILQTFRDGGYTAVYADTHELAQDIVSFFETKGLVLAKQYSIVTIYRTLEAVDKCPITGVELSDYRYGEICANLMLDIISNPALEYQDVIIPYQLHVRKSVRNISGG